MTHTPSDPRTLTRDAQGTCRAVTDERAWELLDDELSAPVATAVHAHLDHCPICRARVVRQRRFLAALRRQRRYDPRASAELRARVRALLHEGVTLPDALSLVRDGR